MDFNEIVKQRQSTRSYKPDKIEEYKIINCIESARLAPSVCNWQPWKFIVADYFELKNKIAQTAQKNSPLNRFAEQNIDSYILARFDKKLLNIQKKVLIF